MAVSANALRIHVHDDTRVLDGMMRLVELARVQRPIDETLCAMCRVVAELANAEVVSVYLRERQPSGDVLVMRGNVGFPAAAVGNVQLGVYEGLTGVVAERRRPVSVAVAQDDERYKHVDGIGEEEFAAYLGVPLLVADEVAGVLVVQRRAPRTFSEADLALASSLTAPFVLVIGRDGARKVAGPNRFVGTSLVRGRAVGAAIVVPPPSATPVSEAAALHALKFDLVSASQRLGHSSHAVLRSLDNLGLVAIALHAHVADHDVDDVLAALERVPYHAASAAKDLTALVEERHREMADLWSFLVSDMQNRLSICGAVLVVQRLGTFMAIEAVARGAAAVVVIGGASPGARDVLEAAQVPVVTGVHELVSRVRCGELLEVEATSGIVRVLDQGDHPA
jgi:signal transduction protein with GAF and PtsI domain